MKSFQNKYLPSVDHNKNVHVGLCNERAVHGERSRKRMRYSILVVTQYYIPVKAHSHCAIATVAELFLV